MVLGDFDSLLFLPVLRRRYKARSTNAQLSRQKGKEELEDTRKHATLAGKVDRDFEVSIPSPLHEATSMLTFFDANGSREDASLIAAR